MDRPSEYSFTRYLDAKKRLDDRALNRPVWEALILALPAASAGAPLKVLEVGCGIGTMPERLIDWGALTQATYTGLDIRADNIEAARERLLAYARRRGFDTEEASGGRLLFKGRGRCLDLRFEAVDLFDFLAREKSGKTAWDLLVAHAFLDLVALPGTLPPLLSLMRPGGFFYFTHNFDGATILEPEIDADLDRQIEALYHQDMHQACEGSDCTGRRLFAHLTQAGARILAAGSSDWVVFPIDRSYPDDEAYFLHFIIHTIHEALKGHPQLDDKRFDGWVEQRHTQIDRGELIYIAHQLDFVGVVGGGRGTFL